MTDESKLTVRILSPAGKLYDGPAVSVSAINKMGPFDILFGHANFFSLLTECDVTVSTGAESTKVPISRGLLKVKGNLVTLFVNLDTNSIA